MRLCFFNDTATTEIYTLSLHDALPISPRVEAAGQPVPKTPQALVAFLGYGRLFLSGQPPAGPRRAMALPMVEVETADRKSTRLNSSHANISYAVFCLKKKTTHPLLWRP